jgi:hypothetical protein
MLTVSYSDLWTRPGNEVWVGICRIGQAVLI